MELQTIRDCYVMFLKLLGKQKMIIDVPDERVAKTYTAKEIWSSIQLLYTATLCSFCGTVKTESTIVIITTVYKQLLKMIKEYESENISHYEKKMEEYNIEICRLKIELNDAIDENYKLLQQLEDSVMVQKDESMDVVSRKICVTIDQHSNDEEEDDMVLEEKPKKTKSSWFPFN
jgi:esterase/lipase